MLGCATLMAFATTPGQSVLVSLFNASYRETLGISVTALSAAYTIGTLLAAGPVPLIGRMADRYGLKIVSLLVTMGFALSLALLSTTTNLLMLALGFFLIRTLGQGALGALANHTTAMWYERKLGRAHAVLAIGGFAAGAALLPQPTAWLIGEIGWRLTLIVLAGLVLLLTWPMLLTVFYNRPEDIGQHLDGDAAEHAQHDTVHGGPPPPGDPAFTAKQAAATRAFWTCTLASVASGMIGTALIFHMVTMLQSAGLEGTAGEAAQAVQAWPIAFAISTIGVGWLVDRFRAGPLLAIGTLLLGLATCVCLIAERGGSDHTVLIMGAGMGLFGISQALVAGVSGPTIARYFGRTHHGSIRGWTSSMGVAGTAGGPLLAGWGYEAAGGSFTPVLIGFALLAVPLTAFALTLRKPEPPRNPDRHPEPDADEPVVPSS